MIETKLYVLPDAVQALGHSYVIITVAALTVMRETSWSRERSGLRRPVVHTSVPPHQSLFLFTPFAYLSFGYFYLHLHVYTTYRTAVCFNYT